MNSRSPNPAPDSRRSAPAAALITGALLAAVLTAGCALSVPDFRLPVPGRPVVYPRIVPMADAPAVASPAHTLTFEKVRVSVQVPVDASVYLGARDGDKTARRLVDVKEADWVPGYYKAFIDEKHLEPFYAAMLGRLHELRSQLGLGDDRYLELLVGVVQTIPYSVDESRPEPKYPIETWRDDKGDCDDKSLLLAALLRREGYDTVLLQFAPEQHVAVGVRCARLSYKGTGYAYIETTTRSLVGVPPDKIGDDGRLTSQPWVISLSTGGKTYGAGDEIAYLTSARSRALAEVDTLAARVKSKQSSADGQRTALDALRSRMNQMRATGDVAGYNALVSSFNTQVSSYNALASELSALADRHNSLLDTIRHIDGHPEDRPGTYLYVKSRL
jgi:hypothetical protein